MSEDFDQAKEQLEQAAERGENNLHARRTAVLIAILAACLALAEFAEKDAETAYLFHHIAVSDTWAQYQDKLVRRTMFNAEAETLSSLSNASDSAIQQRIAAATANAARMKSEPGSDGMEQLAERAHHMEEIRDHELHRKNMLEIASGGLQIAIVLASISVVIGSPVFLWAGLILGAFSGIYALLGGFSLI